MSRERRGPSCPARSQLPQQPRAVRSSRDRCLNGGWPWRHKATAENPASCPIGSALTSQHQSRNLTHCSAHYAHRLKKETTLSHDRPWTAGREECPTGGQTPLLGLFAITPNIGGSKNAALNPSAYQARSARDLACHSLAALQDLLCCACHYYFINERSQAAKHSRRIASPLRRIPDRRAKGPLLDFAWGISGRFNTNRFCVVHGPSRGRLLKHAHVVEGLDAWIERWVAPDNR